MRTTQDIAKSLPCDWCKARPNRRCSPVGTYPLIGMHIQRWIAAEALMKPSEYPSA